jgi:hypothetical protein
MSSAPGPGFSGRTESSVRSGLIGRPRSIDERGGKAGQPWVAPACEPEVAECLLRRLRPLFEAAVEVRDADAERDPDACESRVVFCVF